MSQITARDIPVTSVPKKENQVAKKLNALNAIARTKVRQISDLLTNIEIVETGDDAMESRYNILQNDADYESVVSGFSSTEKEMIKRAVALEGMQIPDDDAKRIIEDCSSSFLDISQIVMNERVLVNYSRLNQLIEQAAGHVGFSSRVISLANSKSHEQTFEDDHGRVLTSRTKIKDDRKIVIEMLDMDGSKSCDERHCKELMNNIWKYLVDKGVTTKKATFIHVMEGNRVKSAKTKVKNYLKANKSKHYISQKS
jgi:hypothetical protein